MRHGFGAGALSLLAAGCLVTAVSAESLQRYNVDPRTVTVSGISSGGAMAVQAHVAYSGTFRAAAVFAGAAYYCAQGNVALAIGRCQEALTASEIPVADLVATTRDWSARGLIDDVANLASQRVYLFSGTLDQTVRQPGMDAARNYYASFMPAGNITYINNVAAGHGWISPLGPVLCELQQSPYINNCLIDPQQVFLSSFYGALQPRQVGALSGTLKPIEQAEFLDDRNPAAQSVDTYGWVYVPASCAKGDPCRLHVSYHGCNQGYAKIGDAFVRLSNLNEWADTNRIIVLYPQAVATPPTNGLGCWDWWGYAHPDYAKKNGPQLLMTKRMVDRVTAGYAPVAAPAGLTAVRVSPTSVRLAWSGAAGATGYRLFRNGSDLGTTIANSDYTDKTVARDTSYTYTVRAVASNGNLGPQSPAVSVSTR
jgi:hypothetical protein